MLMAIQVRHTTKTFETELKQLGVKHRIVRSSNNRDYYFLIEIPKKDLVSFLLMNAVINEKINIKKGLENINVIKPIPSTSNMQSLQNYFDLFRCIVEFFRDKNNNHDK